MLKKRSSLVNMSINGGFRKWCSMEFRLEKVFSCWSGDNSSHHREQEADSN
uniref:AlNc14C491G11916 protein n=1 Tax=Albugo laibachii Nc14 TaxID=890382 RepID=F0X0H2_9STRA|nr:AlNc14C491G11916 [Albugo laibachii Nc14]|eukprot:CCA27262.1 AlNc14C491G11916 [Albugo laibachii Nc14]